jgi:hypothetical protein
VRCLLLPATLALLGRPTWWLPSSLSRLHRRLGLHEDHDSAPDLARGS